MRTERRGWTDGREWMGGRGYEGMDMYEGEGSTKGMGGIRTQMQTPNTKKRTRSNEDDAPTGCTPTYERALPLPHASSLPRPSPSPSTPSPRPRPRTLFIDITETRPDATMRTSLRSEQTQTARDPLPIYATNERTRERRESVRADEGVGWEIDAGVYSARRTCQLVPSTEFPPCARRIRCTKALARAIPASRQCGSLRRRLSV